jgi:hypothetical protein
MRLLIAAALLAAPAFAAQAQTTLTGPKPNEVPLGHATRTFVIRNESGQPIRQAQITTTKGQTLDVTKGSAIANAQGLNVTAPPRDCIDAINVTLQNGKQLGLDHQNQCSLSLVHVQNDRITLSSSAVNPTPSPQ